MNNYTLDLTDVKELQRYYMPFIKNGGIFIPTIDPHTLHDKILLELKLPQDPEAYRVEGSVIWINPEFAQHNRKQGIGIKFESESNLMLKDKIEKLLVGVTSQGGRSTTM